MGISSRSAMFKKFGNLGNSLGSQVTQETVKLSVFGVGEQSKSKMSAIRRNRLSEKRRLINRARKSAVTTRINKVFATLTSLSGPNDVSSIALSRVEKLIAEASSEIDKAVNKGIIHKNTANRRKGRIADAKRKKFTV